MFVVGRFCRADVAGVICLFLLFFCFQSLFNAYINTTFRVIFIEFLPATVVRIYDFSCIKTTPSDKFFLPL